MLLSLPSLPCRSVAPAMEHLRQVQARLGAHWAAEALSFSQPEAFRDKVNECRKVSWR